MSHTHNRKKKLTTSALAAAAAAMATPALLFLGAGTAAAVGGLNVNWTTFAGGITAHVGNITAQSGWCTYSSDWYVAPPFYSEANNSYDLVILGPPENRMWPVHVNCDNGNSYSGSHYY
jgi:hypothetical protein